MTQKYALIGESLSYSLSPGIHSIVYELLGVDATYELMEIAREDFGSADCIERLSKLDGFNVTIPYKEVIMPFLDEISDAARYIGAVNTVKVVDGKFIGYNTDYDGFVSVLSPYFKGKSMHRALVLGTGGAAKMAVYALKKMNVEDIAVVSRDAVKAAEKFQDVRCLSYDEVNQNQSYYDLLVNCTPVGHIASVVGESIEIAQFRNFGFIFDLNYNPPETHYLTCGKRFGVQGVNGYDMLIAQAISADHIWLNVDLDLRIWTQKVKSKQE